jgi:hypothetical protein
MRDHHARLNGVTTMASTHAPVLAQLGVMPLQADGDPRPRQVDGVAGGVGGLGAPAPATRVPRTLEPTSVVDDLLPAEDLPIFTSLAVEYARATRD